MKKYLAVILLLSVMILQGSCSRQGDDEITGDDVRAAQKMAGLEFDNAEIDSLLGDATVQLKDFLEIRKIDIANGVSPAIEFDPVPGGMELPGEGEGYSLVPLTGTPLPEDRKEIAFYSIRQLAGLLRSGRITSLELTRFYLGRLKEYGPSLECVITLTGERAIRQAEKADAEMAAGNFRGLLHGIPFGVKDLFAVEGYPTTWGSEPYRDQVIEETATVVRKLEEEGAVLVAKLTLGALAWGDVWFGGMTRNPWDTTQGSSGSSAGSASATAAGLVPFAIGTETWGSIVSPSTRCGATGLRPTFGRVSRAGAMALSWSMDKVGPICREIDDCAIVFDAIRGSDGIDRTVRDVPFVYEQQIDPGSIRIGYIKSAFEGDYEWKESDARTLEVLGELGFEMVPIELPDYPVYSLGFILSAEAAAAFDQLTRSNRDDLMVRQIRNAWPNTFRAARFIPAVEYIQANRIRHMLIREMDRMEVEIWVSPSFEGTNLLLTNLTGHPCVVLPNGFDEEGHPVSITFNGALFGEGRLLAVAKAYQDATSYHLEHPPLFK